MLIDDLRMILLKAGDRLVELEKDKKALKREEKRITELQLKILKLLGIFVFS